MPSSKHPWTFKRIAALAAVILIAALYILTLVFAIAGFEGAGQLFRACLILTVALPILAWLLIWVIGALKGRRTFADPDILPSGDPVTSPETEDSDGK